MLSLISIVNTSPEKVPNDSLPQGVLFFVGTAHFWSVIQVIPNIYLYKGGVFGGVFFSICTITRKVVDRFCLNDCFILYLLYLTDYIWQRFKNRSFFYNYLGQF